MGQAQPFRPLAMIVEEDEEARDLATILFEESDFDVIACDSAEAALGILRKKGDRVAILLCDLGLSGMIDGVDLARMVRERWPRINVLVTARLGGKKLAQLPRGAAYMPKPWRPLDLLVAAERAHVA